VPELLRPPPHRGPLIAAGAVVLATGVAVAELRLEGAAAAHVLLLGAPAALILALGAQAPNEEGRPPAYQSVLLVTGLLLLYGALLRLADALGADFDALPTGALVWTGILECAAALWLAIKRRSAVCLFIAAIAAGIALLSAFDWIFDPGTFTASRWILLAIAIGLTLASLALRAGAPRHAEMLVDGAALAILVIGLQALFVWVIGEVALFASASLLPNFWELILVGAGCGLVAYGAVDRAPGPAWLGVANLATFALLTGLESDETLYWWPLVLIALGAGAMIAGLRPRRPLPPEPDAYRAGEQPLASRTADDEVVLRVRDDSPPAGTVQDR
jgi:hypothetical protein